MEKEIAFSALNAPDCNPGIDKSVLQIAQGDNTALSLLYRCLKKPVFLLALSILRDESLAEDVMQETFLKVSEKADTYHAGTNPKAWVLTIARNLSLNCLKSRGREELTGKDIDMQFDENNENRAVSSADFMKALQQLDETQQTIVTVRILCDLKHAQIAEMINLSPGDVRIRYHRALKLLKKYYEEN
jgi:RNA polymerase sigma-70 factor (ECF subfamily)